MDKEALLKRIRTIELQTRGMTEQVFAGQYQSAFKGRGMSFSEVRSYQVGDDVRTIDWNVTARFREPFVKIFEEERELTVLLIIDVSGSMYFGQGQDSKISLAVELAATLAFSAAKKNDKVGALFISDEVEYYVPPKKGFGHVHFLLRKLINLKPKSGGTNLDMGLRYARNIFKQRSICFVISDFSQPELSKEGFANTARKHDLVALGVRDQGEGNLPDVGFVRWINAETNTTNWIDSSSAVVRRDYEKNYRLRKERNELFFQQLGIDAAFFEVGDHVYLPLLQLFKRRK